MKNWRMWLGFGAAVFLAILGIVAAYIWWLADPSTIRAGARSALVERGSLDVAVRALGAVAIPERQTLTFGVGGNVAAVAVKEGDAVHVGDVLARLDAAEIQLRVEQAQAALGLSRANLARVQAGPSEAEIIAATAALAAAEAKYEQVIAGPLEAEIASAEANLRSAEATYERLLAGPSEDELTVLKANLDRAQVVLRRAQADYDRFAWREGFGASPQAAALEQATIDYQQALASYNLAVSGPTKDQLEKAQAEIARARADLERLHTVGATDEQKSALAVVTRARAELERLKNSPTPEELAIAQAQVEQASIALEEAKRQLARATLVSPMDGTVLAVSANVGQAISAATPIVVLADLSKKQIQVAVHESHIAGIREGQEAMVHLDALPDQTLAGQVSAIAPVATVMGGLVTYGVTIDLAPTAVLIKPGMIAEAEIIMERKRDVLLVSRGALRLKDGRWVVRAWREGRPQEVAVEIGAKWGRLVEVTSGLSEGERVLLNTVPLGTPQPGEHPWALAFGL